MTDSQEPPLTRQERLRRAILICGACLRNLAYYQAGRKDGKAVFSGQMQIVINNNFLDVGILEWCKLFGEDKHEPHHWQRIIEPIERRRVFKSTLLQHVGDDKRAWNAHRARCLNYRNGFLAHVGSARVMHLPQLELCRRSVAFYASYLFEHENDGRTYGDLQGNPVAFFQHCMNEGLKYYDRLTELCSA